MYKLHIKAAEQRAFLSEVPLYKCYNEIKHIWRFLLKLFPLFLDNILSLSVLQHGAIQCNHQLLERFFGYKLFFSLEIGRAFTQEQLIFVMT